ncbi:MAG: cache domain-containing protein, partial [Spirochaetota bacterium]
MKKFSITQWYAQLTIAKKIIVTVATLNVVAIIIVMSFISWRMNGVITDIAFQNAENLAGKHANAVSAELDASMDTARTVAMIMSGYQQTPVGVRRDGFRDNLKAVFEHNPSFIAVFTIWEPGVLDGRDAQYAREKYDGRFYVNYNRADGRIGMKNVLGYDPNNEDFFRIPKSTGKEYISDPYKWIYNKDGGKEYFEITIAVPIMSDGRFVGVVGIDIELTEIQKLVMDVKPYEEGYAIVVSNNGSRVAHPKTELLGQPVGDDTPEVKDVLLKSIAEGKKFAFEKKALATGRVSRLFYVPFTVGKSVTPWALAVVIPLDRIYEQVLNANIFVAIMGFAAVGVIILIVLMVTRSIGFTIRTMTDETQKLISAAVDGRLDERADSGKVSLEFRGILDGINRTMDAVIAPIALTKEYLNNLAQGLETKNIEGDFKGQYREIVDSINESTRVIRGVVDMINSLIDAADNGKLSFRVDPSKFQNGWKAIAEGLNKIFDNLVQPLQAVGNFVGQLGKGEIPEKTNQVYKGDLIAIRD